MQDITYIKTDDGEPLVRLTLSTPEVCSIFSALWTAAEQHTRNVIDAIESKQDRVPGWRGVEAQAESHRNVGRWEAINDALDATFWDWVNDADALCEDCAESEV